MDITRVIIEVPTDDLDWFFQKFDVHFDSNEYKIIEHYRPLFKDNIKEGINE